MIQSMIAKLELIDVMSSVQNVKVFAVNQLIMMDCIKLMLIEIKNTAFLSQIKLNKKLKLKK